MRLKLIQFIPLIFSLTSITVSREVSFPTTQAKTDGTSVNCRRETLPPMLLTRLRAGYGSWRIQDLPDLSTGARRTWEWDEKKYRRSPLECPGIAVGRFDGRNQSYAVLLVPTDRPDRGYRFLLSNSAGYPLTILEESDDAGARNVFIRKIRISDFFNSASRRQLAVETNDGILRVEAGEDQYGADIFFWAKNSVRLVFVDY